MPGCILDMHDPSSCADKISRGIADLGLVPVAMLPLLKQHHIHTDYCIGAKGAVRSVLLCSQVPLSEIDTLLLDYQSITSVQLIKILCHTFWHINPKFESTKPGFETQIRRNTAGLIIGDRALQTSNLYKYKFDLAEAWYEMTGLPFVFACWVSIKKIDSKVVNSFSKALQWGLNNRAKLIQELAQEVWDYELLNDYLTRNISYTLEGKMKQGMKLFLKMISDPS